MDDIIKRNENSLYRAAVAIMANVACAEDVVQDVFLKLLEKKPKFENEQHEAAWLMRVTVNLCKTRLRAHWRKTSVPLLDVYPAVDDCQRNLIETVLALPAKYRIVIHLHYYEGYNTREIAQITGRKESTVRQHLTRARRMLKEFIEEEGL